LIARRETGGGLQLRIRARQQGRALSVAPPKRWGRVKKGGARIGLEGY